MAIKGIPRFPRRFPIGADVDYRSVMYDPKSPYQSRLGMQIKEYDKTEATSGGSLIHETEVKFSNELLAIIIRPLSSDTTYKVSVKETDSGIFIEKARATRTGEYVIIKPFPVFEQSLTITISNASKDENFRIRVRYR
jgi:hypothetical protein